MIGMPGTESKTAIKTDPDGLLDCGLHISPHSFSLGKKNKTYEIN
jgi:hypothetical protein